MVILSLCSVFDFSIYADFSQSNILFWNKIFTDVSIRIKLVIVFAKLKLTINDNKANNYGPQ